MGIFNLFRNKNTSGLTHEEKEAAQILRNIVQGYKKTDFDYIPNGIEKLSIGLYYLAFKRTNKKVVRLDAIANVIDIIDNPKISQYAAVHAAIQESIELFCKDPRVLRSNISIQEYEATILTLLKYTAEQISRV